MAQLFSQWTPQEFMPTGSQEKYNHLRNLDILRTGETDYAKQQRFSMPWLFDGGNNGGGGGNLSGSYQDAFNKAKEANEKRYDDILKRYNERRDRGLKDIAGQGAHERSRIDRTFDNARSSRQQGLVGGAFNTTVMGNMNQGIARERTEAQGGLDERLRGQRAQLDAGLEGDTLGFMERRNDNYPDINQMIALQQAYGQGGAGRIGMPGQQIGPAMGGGYQMPGMGGGLFPTGGMYGIGGGGGGFGGGGGGGFGGGGNAGPAPTGSWPAAPAPWRPWGSGSDDPDLVMGPTPAMAGGGGPGPGIDMGAFESAFASGGGAPSMPYDTPYYGPGGTTGTYGSGANPLSDSDFEGMFGGGGRAGAAYRPGGSRPAPSMPKPTSLFGTRPLFR